MMNWITLLIQDRSNFYTALFSDSHYSMHLQVAVSANPVGSSKQPERATKTSFTTKSLHKVETPISKQLYGHSNLTHKKPPHLSGHFYPLASCWVFLTQTPEHCVAEWQFESILLKINPENKVLSFSMVSCTSLD